jgi:sporulation protein YhbH
MSIFREHKTSADRSASDRRRHKEKIQKAIKEGIHGIVAEESIIGENGKKKFKIPVRGIKEYKFVYGSNSNKQIGSAPGKDLKKGQKIGQDDSQQSPSGNKAGNEKGEEYYSVEINLDELSQYLFEDLKLPELKRKQLANISQDKLKRSGYRPDGILPRLDKKKSAIARIKRMKASGFDPETAEEGETFPFHEDDLKYRHFKMKQEPCTNAVVFFLMDVSGSMSTDKKFLARSFCFLMYQFLRSKYETLDVVFVTHDAEAREVDEKAFFTQSTYGGTVASTGVTLVHDIIDKRYHPSAWNIYIFQCSDGDNYSFDNKPFADKVSELKEICQLFGYCEISPDKDTSDDTYQQPTTLYDVLQPLRDKKLHTAYILKKEDVWLAFKNILNGVDSEV